MSQPLSKSTKALVSAVIPTRNRPELVCRAVRSALGQTYSNMEVVVVIDGPDSSTVAALESLADPRIRTIALEQNVGGSESRNTGAREAKGEWIALLDDDDEWLPQKIERQIDLAERGAKSSHVAVFCRYIYRRSGKGDQVWPLRLPGGEPISEFMFDRCSGFQTSTFLIKREYFLSRPFRKGLKGHQDWDWFLRASCDPTLEILVEPEPLSVFHVFPSIPRASYSFSWRDSLQWGIDNSSNITPRAYSRFIAYHSARLAVEHRARKDAFIPLARECFLRGAPTPKIAAIFFAVFLLSPNARRYLHGLIGSIGSKRAPTYATQP